MKLEIITKKIELTDYVRKLIDTKLVPKIAKLLRAFEDDEKIATVRLTTRSRWGYKVSLSMYLPGKVLIYGVEVHKDLQAAIVNLREEVVRQIKEYKEKRGSN